MKKDDWVGDLSGFVVGVILGASPRSCRFPPKKTPSYLRSDKAMEFCIFLGGTASTITGSIYFVFASTMPALMVFRSCLRHKSSFPGAPVLELLAVGRVGTP